jgi:hypothetical protein
MKHDRKMAQLICLGLLSPFGFDCRLWSGHTSFVLKLPDFRAAQERYRFASHRANIQRKKTCKLSRHLRLTKQYFQARF